MVVMVAKKLSKNMAKTTILESRKSDTRMRRNDNGADPDCEYCEGEGQIMGDAFDSDSMQVMHGAGYPERCICVVQ